METNDCKTCGAFNKGNCPEHNDILLYCPKCLGNWKVYGRVKVRKRDKPQWIAQITKEGILIDRADYHIIRDKKGYDSSEERPVMEGSVIVDKTKKGEIIGYEILWAGKGKRGAKK